MQNSKKLFVQCLSILFIFNSLNIVAQDNNESVEEVDEQQASGGESSDDDPRENVRENMRNRR